MCTACRFRRLLLVSDVLMCAKSVVCVCMYIRMLTIRDKQGCHFNVSSTHRVTFLFLLHIPTLAHIHGHTHITINHSNIGSLAHIRNIHKKAEIVRNDVDSPILLSHRNRIKYKTNTHFTTFWLAIYLSEEENTRCSFHHILFIVFIFIYTIWDKF